ncbi:MAG: 8-oxo-dGTP diphosphatase MutT [Pseudomonadota bacterium]
MAASPCTAIHVAVAVVIDGEGQVLITQRHKNSHQGGLWEFPGGKVEQGETLGQALLRELSEELDIRVDAHSPLLEITHDYGDKRVLLDVHRVTAFSGTPRPMESQPMLWVAIRSLKDYQFPDANAAIIDTLLADER